MPFIDQHGKFPNPDLQFLGTREFKLTTEFSYLLPDKDRTEFLVAPMKTDLASIPGPLWGLAGPYGKQILPVLLHDTLCNEAKKHHSFEKRKHADDTFRIALGDQGDGRRDVSRIRSRVLWVGSPDVFVGHFRPGSSSSSPPRVSMAMAMRASGEW
jgi:hypothetical protein